MAYYYIWRQIPLVDTNISVSITQQPIHIYYFLMTNNSVVLNFLPVQYT